MRKYIKSIVCSFLASAYVVMTYARRPHSLALKKFGVRIVATMSNPGQKGGLSDEMVSDMAYQALVLLEQYDNEVFVLVKRHIRIIWIFSPNINCNYASVVPTSWLSFINVIRIPVNFPAKSLPIIIAGFLARQAKLVDLKGYMAYFDRVNGPPLLELCRKQHERTIQKLEQAVRESQASDSRQPAD